MVAVILSHSDQASVSPRSPTTQSTSGQNDIEAHLQGMLRVLRPEDTLAMAVRLQSAVDNHVKYLAVLWTVEEDTDVHETALLGFDLLPDGKISIGVTVPIHSFSKVELDGDGGITVNSSSCSCPYFFKPVSIQSMWSLFQCLHKELALASLAAKSPLFCGPISGYHWLNYYHSHVTKDDSICAQWHYSLVDEAAEEEERQIHINLKQIMQSVDLDAVTSKDIRNRLEEHLKVDSLMSMYKEFIDREMLSILGQLDKPSKIFDYLYLGTEWNASNWEELKANKVEYILNVTKEVDNFFLVSSTT
uniref:protein-serine/threonine phosphatase n=1 Tax=Ditylenchus dipsaci TaxID=166011 RepID=A0A915EIF8_9BILA